VILRIDVDEMVKEVIFHLEIAKKPCKNEKKPYNDYSVARAESQGIFRVAF
jgi:hypothetical protein